jgi:hypothetical protein
VPVLIIIAPANSACEKKTKQERLEHCPPLGIDLHTLDNTARLKKNERKQSTVQQRQGFGHRHHKGFVAFDKTFDKTHVVEDRYLATSCRIGIRHATLHFVHGGLAHAGCWAATYVRVDHAGISTGHGQPMLRAHAGRLRSRGVPAAMPVGVLRASPRAVLGRVLELDSSSAG